MIIYQDTKAGFVDDIANNYFAARLEDAFIKKTGSLPAGSRGWANDYARFSTVLGQAKVADDVQIAIEYHCSPIGRYRIDVMLAGSDGKRDNALIIELKAWDTASVAPEENMVFCPIGGGSKKDHPNLQARNYKAMIVRFNEDVVKEGIEFHPSAFLFNLYRREPEPLEDARYTPLLAESRLFLADDVSGLKSYLEELVPKKATKDVFFLLEHGKWVPSDPLIARVESMLSGNEDFILIDEQDEAFRIIRHQVLDDADRTHRHVFVIEGGPGTGKSVIAVRLLAETLKKKRMAFFVWAASRDGIGQVGCVHTSQGLEFDWMGVLIGDDLVWRDGAVQGEPAKRARTDKSLHGWKGEFKAAEGDPAAQKAVMAKVDDIIKSTYRVLLSRGRKGCYVWCKDEGLREYFKKRLALAKAQPS